MKKTFTMTLLSISLLASTWAVQAKQAPILLDDESTDVVFAAPTSSVEKKSTQTDKPAVTILATGGTIAGQAPAATDTTDYKAGALGIDILINAVPEMKDIAQVKGEQIANTDSNNIDNAILLTLSKRINALLSSASQQGVVVTHGTDTLEETALFIDLTVNQAKPVVIVGAMRPASAISADGPMNLFQAVKLAADPQAQQRGTLVVLNDRISSGFYITKTNTSALDTFKSVEQGYLGTFIGTEPKFYYTPAQPVGKPYFDVSNINALPKVVIIYSHQQQDGQLIKAAIADGAKGIVIAGTGNGNISNRYAAPAIKDAIAQGIPVVISSRTGSGYVTTHEPKGSIGSGFYNPQKSRIVLMLALATGKNIQQIQQIFAGG